MQPIQGEHLVNPDGTLDLGSWGEVHVAGKTLAEIKRAIEKLVDAEATRCRIEVSVFSQKQPRLLCHH